MSRIIRWKAIVPLLLFIGFVAGGWLLFADPLARRGLEAAGTAAVGARVEIERLHLDLAGGKIEIHGLTVASPHEALKNLFQADELVADIDVLPLLEKKVVINRLAANGLRTGTPRETDGRLPRDTTAGADTSAGMAAAAWQEARAFAGRLEVPALQLTTGEIDIGQLDPTKLATAREAEALMARADSSRRAWQTQLDGLAIQPAVDSAAAALQRLRGARATDLALLNDARRAVDQLKRARDRVTALERGVAGGAASLRDGVGALDAAKQRDYAFARSLLKLPSLDASDIGAALFGRAAAGKFERAMYWTQLARRWMPPGLLPQADAGPKRARRAGLNVRFPKERALPGFLLRQGELSFILDAAGPNPRPYAGTLTGLTSSPALYGRPTTFTATAPAVQLGALLDHVRGTPTDTASASIAGVKLPDFALPSLPLRLEPGRGAMTLSFALDGDNLRAHWGVRSTSVRWARDSAAAAGSAVEQLVWRVLEGIETLELSADVRGSLSSPRLSIRSNLDDAVSQRLRAVVGEEVAAAERRLRGEVDRLVDEKAGPARARATAVTSEVNARIAEQKAGLDRAQRDLEQRIREITRGIRLP